MLISHANNVSSNEGAGAWQTMPIEAVLLTGGVMTLQKPIYHYTAARCRSSTVLKSKQ